MKAPVALLVMATTLSLFGIADSQFNSVDLFLGHSTTLGNAFQFQDVNSEGLAVDSIHGVLYVSDRKANQIYVWKNIFSNTITNSTPPSLVLGAFFAGSHLNGPAGLFVDSAGTLWCADQYNFRVVW